MKQPRPSTADKRRVFRSLHESGCFLLPNPWDVGSAVYLQSLGFNALATTSAGFAWSQGCPDGGARLEQVLMHLRALVEATDVPVNADFEGGFAVDPERVGEHVQRACDTGIAGLSIEDSTGNASRPLYDLAAAAERIRAARGAIDRAGGEALLVGRAQCFVVGIPDIAETIIRLKTYALAGADCLFAPGVRDSKHIEILVESVAPKPLNVLIDTPATLTVSDLARLGVRRVSVGGALARSAWSGFMRAAKRLAEEHQLDGLPGTPAGGELDSFFAARRVT